MSIAIYTFKTISEMAAKLTEHPIRGVKNGDVALVVGDTKADDVISYTAVVTSSPTTSLPDSVASNDGKVQWNAVAKSYGAGNVPRSLEIEVLNTTASAPQGWGLDSTSGALSMTAGASVGYDDEGAGWLVGTDLWLADHYYINKIDLADDNRITSYRVPALPGMSLGALQKYRKAYCAEDDTIRFMGDYDGTGDYHHHFDIATETFYVSTKAAVPASVVSPFLYDNSATDGYMYLFTNTANIYLYDVGNDTWPTTRTSGPGAVVTSVIADPNSPGDVLVLTAAENLYRYTLSTDTWDTLSPLTGISAFNFQPMWYDETDGLFKYISLDDVYEYDADLDSWSTNSNIIPDGSYGGGFCVPLGNGFVYIIQVMGYGIGYIQSMNGYSTYTKE